MVPAMGPEGTWCEDAVTATLGCGARVMGSGPHAPAPCFLAPQEAGLWQWMGLLEKTLVNSSGSSL